MDCRGRQRGGGGGGGGGMEGESVRACIYVHGGARPTDV